MRLKDPASEMNPRGNERLTAAVGLLVVIPVSVEVASILLGVHSFMSLHVFVGLALIPAVLLKLGSTGWRFVRYYSRNRAYVAAGPPEVAMRMLAPLFVVATVVLFGSGFAMGFLHGHDLQLARRLHGPAAVIWLALLGIHVLAYFGRALRSAADDALPATHEPVRGTTARRYAVSIVVIGGLVLAAAMVPTQHRWVDLPRDHHDRGAAAQRNVTRLSRSVASLTVRGAGSAVLGG